MSKKVKAVLDEDMKMNSSQKTARVAAFVFLIIFFLGMSTELFIRPGMIVSGDAAAIVRNIAASEAFFRLSLVSDLIRQALLMLLTLILYKLLKPQIQNLKNLAFWCKRGLVRIPKCSVGRCSDCKMRLDGT
jgi:hypothetical protein